MVRLPIPGSDGGDWGDILNAYLAVSHNSDGSLANNIVGSTQLDTPTQTAIASVASKYVKPSGGIPASDLTSAAQASLTTASTALQTSQLGIASGVAQLDTNSTLKSSQLPSSVVSKSTVNTYTADQYFGSGRPWYDVIALGADPTGTTDSTSAIQTAINNANSNGGGIVRIPWGTYKCNITLLAHVVVEGSGQLGTVLKPYTNGPVISGSASTYLSEAQVRRLSIYGNASDATNDGIYLPPGINVASVTVSTSSTTVTVSSGGFPSVGTGSSWFVGGSAIPSGTTVTSASGNNLVLSATPTASGTFTLTFTNSIGSSNRCVFEDVLIRNCGRYGVNITGGRIIQSVHQFDTFRNIECTNNVSDGWNMSGAIEQCLFEHCDGLSNGGNGMTHTRLLDGSGNSFGIGGNTFIRLFLQGSGTGSPNGTVTTTTYGLYSDGTGNTYLQPYVEGNGLTDTTRASCGICLNLAGNGPAGNLFIEPHLDSHFVDFYNQAGTGNQLTKPVCSFAAGSGVTVTSCVLNATNTVTVASGGFSGVAVGTYVQSSGNIAFPTTVTAINGNTLTLSQAATTSTTATLKFYPDVFEGGNTKPCFIQYGGGDQGLVIEFPKFSGTPSLLPIHPIATGGMPHVTMLGSTDAYGFGPLSGNDFTGVAAPTTGTWYTGSTIFAASPVAGGPMGWICTASGSPGTWQPFGKLAGVASTLTNMTISGSPMSYTATQPSNIYVVAGAWTSVTVNGTTVAATNPSMVHLETGDVAVFTYTAAPTSMALQTMGSGGF